jgi:hypothetical protein
MLRPSHLAKPFDTTLHTFPALLADEFVVGTHTKKKTEDHVATVAPGQTIRHYSPHIPSFIVAQSLCLTAENISPADEAFLAKSVMIDFGAKQGITRSMTTKDYLKANDSFMSPNRKCR